MFNMRASRIYCFLHHFSSDLVGRELPATTSELQHPSLGENLHLFIYLFQHPSLRENFKHLFLPLLLDLLFDLIKNKINIYPLVKISNIQFLMGFAIQRLH